MGRKSDLYDRTVHALKGVIENQGKLIDKLQSEDKIPHEYSLGFINALIFTLYRLEGKKGEPKFFQHKGVIIGKLPKPTHFSTDEFEPEAQLRQEKIVETARELVDKCVEIVENKKEGHQVIDAFGGELTDYLLEQLRTDIKNLDMFIDEIEKQRSEAYGKGDESGCVPESQPGG